MISHGLRESNRTGYMNLVQALDVASQALDNAKNQIFNSDSQYLVDTYHDDLHAMSSKIKSISANMDRLGYRTNKDLEVIAVGGMDHTTWDHLRK